MKGFEMGYGERCPQPRMGDRPAKRLISEGKGQIPLWDSKHEAPNNAWGVPGKASRRRCCPRRLLKDE